MPDYTRIDDAIRHALDGSAILFVGAGLSFLSKNIKGITVPNGKELSGILHDATNIKRDTHTLDRISGHYIRTLGANNLCNLLKEQFTVSSIDNHLAELYRLDWRRIYTTNYDNAIGIARNGMRTPQPLTLHNSPENIPLGAQIHLNGHINTITPFNVETNFLLSDYSYATSNFKDSRWAHYFSTDIRICRSIIFVGYSLYDLDIARILIEDSAIKNRAVFIVAPDADPVEVGTLEHYGTVYAEGFELLTSRLQKVSADYTPQDIMEQFNSIEELNKSICSTRISPTVAVYEQLVYGRPPISEILNGAQPFSGQNYLVERGQVVDAVAAFRNGKWRDLLLTGDIASGKTFAAIQLAKGFLELGYRTFWVNTPHNLRAELDTLARSNDKICLIVDGYRNCIDEIKTYINQRQITHTLIITERTATHEMLANSLVSSLNLNSTSEIALDSLKHIEINGLDALINFAGLWGEVSGLPKQQRARYVAEQLEGSLYRLFLEIVKSEKVRTEIESLLKPLADDEHSLKFFITAFIVNVLGYNFWINDWQSFYDIGQIRNIMRKYSDHIRHFLFNDNASIRPRSSLMSKWILRQFSTDSTIKDCLINMYTCACRNTFGDDEFNRISVDIMKYSVVEPLFSDKNKLASLVNYYEGIRPIGNTRDNPDYWLQYGIASTIHGDLNRAELAFKNAYSREKARSRPNLTRIDNYFSRFEMEKAIATDDSEEAFRLFKTGADRLMKQIFLNNNRHYPFKTGRAFGDIAGKHYGNWSDNQKTAFMKMCKDIRAKALAWQKENQSLQTDVSILISETAKIIRKIDPQSAESALTTAT